ncbi:MAG: lamin tail domain-containing protein [Bacteroidaceae bacterium]|nr:lamin tail domain-containing protein [Bacteroidaceae bacterium]
MKHFPRLFIAAVACLGVATGWAQTVAALKINEVMSANIDQFMDPSWNYGGWIEIYNPATKELNLNGLWLSDDPDNLQKIHITYDTPIPSRGFTVLWFGHHYVMALKQIEMKLDTDGGTICLSNSSGRLIDQVDYPPAIPRTSWARTANGGREWSYSALPTPGKTNAGNAFASQRLPTPNVSHDSRIFSRAMSVKVEIPEGATLRYTTDGSTPTLEHGETSETGEFTVLLTRIYRFALFQDGYLPSPVVTRSYIRKDKNFNIPVVSVVTDPDNLYSNQTGVFVKGTNGRRGKGTDQYCNWNMDWDRPINIEIFDKTGKVLLNQEAELSRCGGHSKGFTPMSFKVKATKKYEGLNYLPYQMFPEKAFLKHRGLQFRCGGNDYHCRIRDAALQSLVQTSGIDVDLQDYQPVCHYINGKYMGTINMREPNNKLNVYANHGLDDDEIDMFEIDCDSCYIQMCGTKDAWRELRTLSAQAASDESYTRLQQMVDIDELCNYMAIEFYLANNDWPQNNCKGWRPIRENGKFRFILYDLDLTFGFDNPFQVFPGRQNYTFCELFDVPGMADRSHFTRQVDLVPIFLNLLKNKEFARHFLDAICLVGGSVYEPTRSESLINQLVNVARPMQVLASGYAGRNDDPGGTASTLISQLKSRPNTMNNALQSYSILQASSSRALPIKLKANVTQARLLVNGQQVPGNAFNGTLYRPVTVRAMAPEGWVFKGWMYGDALISENEELALGYVNIRQNLVATYERDESQPLARPVVINEVSAGNSIFVNEYFKKNDWIELFNTTDQRIDLSGMYLSDDISNPLKYRIPEGNDSLSTYIQASGFRIIWCDQLEPVTQLHAPFKLANADSALVLLTAADQSWCDTLVYCAHEGSESVGRFPDGGTQLYRMYRPTICGPNAMNSYTTLWEEPAAPTGIRQPEMASAQGSMSIRCSQGVLFMKSEDDNDVTLTVYALNGTNVMQQHIQMEQGRAQASIVMLARGTYIARLTDSQGNQCAAKFVR